MKPQASCIFVPSDQQQCDGLEALIISELDGDLLSLPTAAEFDGWDERIALAVFKTARMRPERWDRLSPAQRIPWLRKTLEVLRKKHAAMRAKAVAGIRPAPGNANPFAKKLVNARMLEKMHGDPDCHGWTCRQWAKFLRCSEASVVMTPAWTDLQQKREKLNAEHARDRRGRGVGRRRGDYGDR